MSEQPLTEPDWSEAGTDWEIARDGRMADYAAPDDAVKTVPWTGDDS